MTTYVAPKRDMLFAMKVADLDGIAALSGPEELSPDIVQAILDEAGKFAAEVLAPLNKIGDRNGARIEAGVVRTAPGFKDAYHQYAANGWTTLTGPPKFGGQGMPALVAVTVNEMWAASNLAFSLCPMLMTAAVEAISRHGSETLKKNYLKKIVTGEWTAAMCLTEPQAGSDLAAVRTQATPDADAYRLRGTKIFITYGDHDYTPNIVHMVLARLAGAPLGIKGLSLFLVPKYPVAADGSLGPRNDMQCLSLEHKLGIHASPTAVMAYGEKAGAVAYLVGEPNRGIEHMFTMMNHARLDVAVQGVALADRAYQLAAHYARERVQGKPMSAVGDEHAGIIQHPDVRRMLMSMKAQAEALRAFICMVAGHMDRAARDPDPKQRERHQARLDLLTPVAKGWATEQAVEVASIGIQVHGGMGFVEETGAAQLLRDTRIITIYEGTTGIQAVDLVGRKLARDAGAAVKALMLEMRATCRHAAETPGADFTALNAALVLGVTALEEATAYMLDAVTKNPRAAAAGSVPYLMLLGTVAGGWQMTRAALAAQAQLSAADAERGFHRAKIATARFYAEHILPRSGSYRYEILLGAESTLALEPEQFFLS